MNLKDYQRGRNDGLALALKIVQEGGREALEAEIKNRGVTGISVNLTNIIMERNGYSNFMFDKSKVRQEGNLS